jgi:hypothetical protein
MSLTNETTNAILSFLFSNRIFAWRQNSGGIPLFRDGILTGFRPGGKTGQPDIVGILPSDGKYLGTYLGIEVKTGKDRLSEGQISFHKQARDSGAVILVVKDFLDFLSQWEKIHKLSQTTSYPPFDK